MKDKKKRNLTIVLSFVLALLLVFGSMPAFAAGNTWRKNSTGWWVETANGGYLRSQFYTEGNATYYLDASGYMVTGWQFLNGSWYYFAPSGNLLKGWQTINGHWYYLNPQTGAMLTGWAFYNGDWYYLGSSGAMQTGWQLINGQWYYLQNNGVMAANEWIHGYWFSMSGAWTYPYMGSWKENSTGRWYEDTSGWYAKNTTVKIDGIYEKFDSRGYWVNPNPQPKPAPTPTPTPTPTPANNVTPTQLPKPTGLKAVWEKGNKKTNTASRIVFEWDENANADYSQLDIVFPTGKYIRTAQESPYVLEISDDYPSGSYNLSVRYMSNNANYKDGSWAGVSVTVQEKRYEDVTPTTPTDNEIPNHNPSTPEENPSDNNEETHVHEWKTVNVISQPTCSHEGKLLEKCQICKQERETSIPKNSHQYAIVARKDATETEAGYIRYQCKVCKDSYDEILAPEVHEHVWKLVAAEATCTQGGLPETHRCTICGKIKELVENGYISHIPALGHDYTTVVNKQPTCTEAGSQTKTCTRCRDVVKESIPATGHQETKTVVQTANCTRDGITKYTCATCGNERTETQPKTGHIWACDTDACYVCIVACSHAYTDAAGIRRYCNYNVWGESNQWGDQKLGDKLAGEFFRTHQGKCPSREEHIANNPSGWYNDSYTSDESFRYTLPTNQFTCLLCGAHGTEAEAKADGWYAQACVVNALGDYYGDFISDSPIAVRDYILSYVAAENIPVGNGGIEHGMDNGGLTQHCGHCPSCGKEITITTDSDYTASSGFACDSCGWSAH